MQLMRCLKILKTIVKLAFDTNVVIAYREGISEGCNRVEETNEIILSVTVIGALQNGAINCTKTRNNEKFVHKFAGYFRVFPIDESVAAYYVWVRLSLDQRGNQILRNDIWIAAACTDLEVPLISRDEHFKEVPGLNVISWDNT